MRQFPGAIGPTPLTSISGKELTLEAGHHQVDHAVLGLAKAHDAAHVGVIKTHREPASRRSRSTELSSFRAWDPDLSRPPSGLVLISLPRTRRTCRPPSPQFLHDLSNGHPALWLVRDPAFPDPCLAEDSARPCGCRLAEPDPPDGAGSPTSTKALPSLGQNFASPSYVLPQRKQRRLMRHHRSTPPPGDSRAQDMWGRPPHERKSCGNQPGDRGGIDVASAHYEHRRTLGTERLTP